MSTVVVYDGDQVFQHPDAVKTYEFDFDYENLAPTVMLTSAPTVVIPYKGPNTTPAIIGSAGLVAGNRKTIFQFSGGTEHTVYRVTVTPGTNESPFQIKPKWVYILVEK